MLNLYYKPTCPYAARVLVANEHIKAPLVLLNVSADLSLRDVVLEKGGKAQFPYLEDTDTGISMYESADIIVYLAETYGKKGEFVATVTASTLNVCPID